MLTNRNRRKEFWKTALQIQASLHFKLEFEQKNTPIQDLVLVLILKMISQQGIKNYNQLFELLKFYRQNFNLKVLKSKNWLPLTAPKFHSKVL